MAALLQIAWSPLQLVLEHHPSAEVHDMSGMDGVETTWPKRINPNWFAWRLFVFWCLLVSLRNHVHSTKEWEHGVGAYFKRITINSQKSLRFNCNCVSTAIDPYLNYLRMELWLWPLNFGPPSERIRRLSFVCLSNKPSAAQHVSTAIPLKPQSWVMKLLITTISKKYVTSFSCLLVFNYTFLLVNSNWY